MPARPNLIIAVFALAFVTVGTVHAAPPARASAPLTIPDYGGRDSSLPSVGETAPNPAAQAGRAFEALVVVLAGVVGVVYVLKRFNLVAPGRNGKPARMVGPRFGRSPVSENSAGVTVVSSQTLPGGTMLHVVRVEDRNLLLASTAQSVTSVAEWAAAAPETPGMADEFEGYLTRADPTSGIAAANARLRSLLSPQPPEEPS